MNFLIQCLCVELILMSISKAVLLKAIHSRGRHDVEFFIFAHLEIKNFLKCKLLSLGDIVSFRLMNKRPLILFFPRK